MDQRQGKIIEGAGLEESRLNTDFIRWLQKWGTPLLFALAVLAGGYSVWNWWERSQQRALNEAYSQLTAAQQSGSPDGLLRVAREHAGRGAVPEIATLSAADVFRASAMTRIAPGGKPDNEADKLNDEQRKANLEQAKALYTDVITRVGSDKNRALIALNARFGRAATIATLGDIPGAQKELDETAEAAKVANLPGKAEEAARIKAELNRVASLPPLLTKEQVAASARPVPAMPAPMDPSGLAPTLPPLQNFGPIAPPMEGAPAPSSTDAPLVPPASQPAPPPETQPAPAPVPAPGGEGAPKP